MSTIASVCMSVCIVTNSCLNRFFWPEASFGGYFAIPYQTLADTSRKVCESIRYLYCVFIVCWGYRSIANTATRHSRLSTPRRSVFNVSYVYINICHVHIILHYCPLHCIGKQANTLSHVMCSHRHRIFTSVYTQHICF